MNQTELVEKIKSKGHTRIILRPGKHNEERITSLANCRSIIETCKVSMRGWDFPHVDKDLYAADQNYIYSGTDWSRYKEYWRFYQSGQFIYLGGMYEDWEQDSIGLLGSPGKSLGFKGFAVDGNFYRITEILEFAARLVSKEVFDGFVNIEITLHDTLDRQLFFYERGRHLFREYKARLSEIKFSKKYSEGEILARGNEIAVEIAYFFFERFNWDRLDISLLKEMQQKFITGKY